MSDILEIVKGAIRASAARKPFHDKWIDSIELKDSSIIMRNMGFREDMNSDIIAALESAGYHAVASKEPYRVRCGPVEYYTLIKVSQTA